MRPALALLVSISLCCVAGSSHAQSRWSLEASSDASVARGKPDGLEFGTGAGFGASIRFRVRPHLAVFAGWEWHHFPTNEPSGVDELHLEGIGYTVGLRFEHPFESGGTGPTYWVRAGGLLEHITVESVAGDHLDDTAYGPGWELGGGVTIPVSGRVALAPGVRYRSLKRELNLAGAARDVTLSYVAAGVGLVIPF